jgi:flagellar biosynthesis activator protein FlaF
MTTATHEKLDAYKTHQRKNESDREIEARALLICASQLDTARGSRNDAGIYMEAIKRNQRLWTIFQVALCDPSNPLPHELKRILLNLSCYVDRVSFRALAEFKPPLLDSLIDINRGIATGLSKKMGTENQAPVGAPALPQGSVMTSA